MCVCIYVRIVSKEMQHLVRYEREKKALGYRILQKAVVGSMWRAVIAISTVESKRKDHLFIFPYYNIYTVRNQVRKNKQTCNGQWWSIKDTWSGQIKRRDHTLEDLMMIWIWTFCCLQFHQPLLLSARNILLVFDLGFGWR